MTEEEQLAAEFETHRPYLHAIAFRVLGSHADADDAVQEAWLRLARTGGGDIEDLRGWLTTVTGRICLDALRRRGVRGEQPLELASACSRGRRPRTPGSVPRRRPCSRTPSASRCTSSWTPSPPPSGCRSSSTTSSRSRSTPSPRSSAGAPRPRRCWPAGPAGGSAWARPATAADAAAREVVDAFFAAASRGDLAGLLALLAPEVELRAQGPGGAVILRGAGEVAGQARDRARAPGCAGPSGARRRRPWRPRHDGRAADHGHGLHGHRRRHHGHPRADRSATGWPRSSPRGSRDASLALTGQLTAEGSSGPAWR